MNLAGMTKQQQREAIQQDTENFLAAGGQIQRLETGETAETRKHKPAPKKLPEKKFSIVMCGAKNQLFGVKHWAEATPNAAFKTYAEALADMERAEKMAAGDFSGGCL